MTLKEQLYQQCLDHVNERLQTIEYTIQSNQKALTSETKSSAGDKHETGRAMLQLEMEKAGKQLQSIRQMKEVLSKIDLTKRQTTISLGARIETNWGSYFLSVSAGQLNVNNKTYFAISTSSPIGKALLGKKVGEKLTWNDKILKIQGVF